MKVPNKLIKSLVDNPSLGYVKSIKLDILKNVLLEADKSYYNENDEIESKLSDELYDLIKDYVNQKDPDFVEQNIGNKAIIIVDTKIKLPVWMGSMDKKKSLSKPVEHVVISDKLDGISCLVHLKQGMTPILYTRGNGEYGRNISHLVKYFNNIDSYSENELMIRGELLLKTKTFEKYRCEESNARNTVGGFVNSKKPDEKFKNHIDFVAYELIKPSGLTPTQQFEYINKNTSFKVVDNKYIEQVSNEVLSDTLSKRKQFSEYEIDGIIVAKNDIYEHLKSGNPKHAFAYKENSLEKRVVTTVIKVEWNISKDGYLKPLVYFEHIVIDNVKIQKATGHNAKFIKDNSIGKGSEVIIERSGDVIPKIVSVSVATSPDMPNVKYLWNKTNTDIIIDDDNSHDELKKKQFEFILTTIKFDHLGKGIITKLYSSNIKTIKQLFALTEDDILKIEGFKKKSAENLYKSIQKRKSELTCLDYMVASNMFGRGLSRKNLEKIIKEYDPLTTNPTIDNIENIEGLGKIYAKQYIESFPKFKQFLNDNNLECITCIKDETTENKTQFKDMVFVFSGFRQKSLEEYIVKNSGKVSVSISSKITYLIVNKIDDSSSKQVQAKTKEVKIITKERFFDKFKIEI